MSKRKGLAVIIFAVLIALFTAYCFYENNALQLSKIEVSSEKLPESFDGMRIIHISDLHNKSFGRQNEKLLSVVKSQNPDIIVMTGDLIDKRRTDESEIGTAVDVMREFQKIAPTYFICGNHETTIGYYDKLERELRKARVTIMNDRAETIERNGEWINIAGVTNYSMSEKASPKIKISEEDFESLLAGLKKEDSFNLLLAHRPERFEYYKKAGFDLTLSGHAHGGQWRIFGLPLVAPDQGFFGAYTAGLYEENEGGLIVSRGLGNSIIPMRINNRPEVILVTLSREK